MLSDIPTIQGRNLKDFTYVGLTADLKILRFGLCPKLAFVVSLGYHDDSRVLRKLTKHILHISM